MAISNSKRRFQKPPRLSLSVDGKFGGNFAINFNNSSILLKMVENFDHSLLYFKKIQITKLNKLVLVTVQENNFTMIRSMHQYFLPDSGIATNKSQQEF